MWEIIAAIIAALTGVITAYFNYKNKKDSDLQKQLNADKESFIRQKIKETEEKLITAMETDITSVPLLRKTLEHYRKQLKKYISIIIILILPLISGCFTTNGSVIIGERILKPNPGDVLTVPALKPPAKQWYLIDDKAMLEVLGVEKPVIPDTVIGIKK